MSGRNAGAPPSDPPADAHRPHESVLRHIHSLQPLSAGMLRMLDAVDPASGGTERILRIVEGDPVLATRVLRLGGSRGLLAIDGLAHVVDRLGPPAIIEHLLVMAVTRAFRLEERRQFDLWHHAIVVASLSRELAAIAAPGIPAHEVYAAGLLHDLARLFIATATGHEPLEESEGACDDDPAAPGSAFHASLGCLLALRWGIAEVVCLPIEHHHEPGDVVAELPPWLGERVRLLQAADRLGMALSARGKIGVKGDDELLAAARRHAAGVVAPDDPRLLPAIRTALRETRETCRLVLTRMP